MSLGPSQSLDVCCSHCFYTYQITSESIPVARLMAVKLQISQMGAEFECPRCKGNFLVNEDLTRASVNSAMQSTVPAEKRFEHSPHFNLQGSSAARMEESVSSSIF